MTDIEYTVLVIACVALVLAIFAIIMFSVMQIKNGLEVEANSNWEREIIEEFQNLPDSEKERMRVAIRSYDGD